jgi:hypothetical protein
MALTAESALPLQKENTDKKRKARMPLGKYFKGKGEEAMSDMKDRYGEDKGQRVFYATANKRGLTADENKSKSKPAKRKTVGQMIAEG